MGDADRHLSRLKNAFREVAHRRAAMGLHFLYYAISLFAAKFSSLMI